MMKIYYKGYTANLSYSAEDDTIIGRVCEENGSGRCYMAFHGDNLDELKKAFHDMIDAYEEMLFEDGTINMSLFLG